MIDGLSGLWDAPAGGNRVCCRCGVVAHASVFPALAETTGSRAAGEEGESLRRHGPPDDWRPGRSGTRPGSGRLLAARRNQASANHAPLTCDDVGDGAVGEALFGAGQLPNWPFVDSSSVARSRRLWRLPANENGQGTNSSGDKRASESNSSETNAPGPTSVRQRLTSLRRDTLV
jgi:hypothetical protein